MNLRRTTIKGIISVFSSFLLLPDKLFACGVTDERPIDVFVNKKYLKKFHFGNIEKFLHSEYKDIWSWSKDVIMTPGGEKLYTAENRKVAPINVLYDISYNEQEIYCSNIDIIYAEENSLSSYAIYVISSVRFGKNTIPYYSTRIRMSSKRAKVYAALTFRNIRTNEILDTKVSYLATKLKAHSCNPLNFIYIDA